MRAFSEHRVSSLYNKRHAMEMKCHSRQNMLKDVKSFSTKKNELSQLTSSCSVPFRFFLSLCMVAYSVCVYVWLSDRKGNFIKIAQFYVVIVPMHRIAGTQYKALCYVIHEI